MRTNTAIVALLIFLMAATKPTAPKPTTTESGDLGAKVADFCKTHLGQKVGSGQCSALAYQALGDVGAKRRGKDSPEKGDYTWGKLALVVEAPAGDAKVTQYENGKPPDLRAGDIIQLRDAKFVHHNGNKTSGWGFGHHTAVVSSVDDGGKTIHIYQQNINGKQFVTEATLRLDDLTAGWLRFYHPVPKDSQAEEPEPKE